MTSSERQLGLLPECAYQGGAGTRIGYFGGSICEVGYWDVALTDDEVLLLSRGFSPTFVRPANLIAYYPLLGRTSPEIDLVGGFNLTLTGTSVSDHPRILLPQSSFVAAATVDARVSQVGIEVFTVPSTRYAYVSQLGVEVFVVPSTGQPTILRRGGGRRPFFGRGW